MTDGKPTIVLGDEQETYNKQAGEFDTYLPVEVRVDTEDEARKVGKIISEHWNDDQ